MNQHGWQAELHLGFVRSLHKTVLARRDQRGPLTVQRPFYPEGDVCHVYLLHPPGGIVAGDHLLIDAHVGSAATALITTPAAGKCYRSEGALATQTIALTLAQDAALEWLPQETVLYNGARFQSTLHISACQNSALIAWEILVFGRPACDEAFTAGGVELNWQIFRDREPVLLEKMRIDQQAFSARWGLQGHPVCATLIALSATTTELDIVRNLIDGIPGLGVTLIDDLLICRALADSASFVRQKFETIRTAMRRNIIQRDNCTPRIWAT